MVHPVQSVLRHPTQQTHAVAAGRVGTSGVKTQQAHAKDPHAVEAGAMKALQLGGLMMPLMFMGDMATRALGFVVGGGVGLVHKPTGNKIKSWLRAGHEALHVTSANDLGSLGKNFRTLRTAIATHGSVPEHLAESLATQAPQASRITSAITATVAPVGKPVAAALGALDNTGPMKAITSSITSFATKRESSLIARGKDATRWSGLKNFGGVGNAIRNLPSKLGNAKLFGLLAVAGAVMTTGAMTLGNRRSNREDRTALKEFAADIYGVDEAQLTPAMLTGPQAHPIVAEASKIYGKNVTGRRIMNIFGVAGDALMANNMGATVSMPLVAAEMGLPALGGLFASENPTLAIYGALKQADAGELTLTPEQKTQAIAQLLATVPAVAKNGGVSNQYVMPVADAMVKRGMSSAQIVQTIASPEAFQKISQEVIADIQKEQAAVKAAAPVATSQQAVMVQPSLHQAAPKPVVGVIAHEGTVAQTAAKTR